MNSAVQLIHQLTSDREQYSHPVDTVWTADFEVTPLDAMTLKLAQQSARPTTNLRTSRLLEPARFDIWQMEELDYVAELN